MIKKILVIILVAAVSLIALVLAIEENAYSLDFYMESFENNNIVESTGRTLAELEVISKDIIGFLQGKDNTAMNRHFNDREITHMDDVLQLFNIARVIKYVSFIVALFILLYFIYNGESKFAGKWMLIGLFSNYIILTILGILVQIDFTTYFTHFHEIFFNNDLWILNPDTDLLIQMLPETFFINMAKNIGLDFVKYLVLAQFIAYIVFRKGDYGIGRFKWQRM